MVIRETGRTDKTSGFVFLYLFVGPICIRLAEDAFFPLPEQKSLIPTLVYVLFLAVVFFAVPWVSSHWVRALRARVAADHPHTIVEIVKFWGPSKSPLTWRVILVDAVGIAVLSQKSENKVGWASVGSIEVVDEGMFPEGSIRVLLNEGEQLMRFAPTLRQFNLKRRDLVGVKDLSDSINATFREFEKSQVGRHDN